MKKYRFLKCPISGRACREECSWAVRETIYNPEGKDLIVHKCAVVILSEANHPGTVSGHGFIMEEANA